MENAFCLDDDICYLNHAAVSPWPVAARDAIIAFAEENASRGAEDYPRWMKVEADLREKLRKLINAAASDDIALLKSTSEGLSFVAAGLAWSAGDNILIPAGEFPSNRVVWESLRSRGVELRQVDIHVDDPERALIEMMDERTRLLSCSSVQYHSGLKLDLEKLGGACRANGTLFCVDAIQSLGAAEFDVERVGADFVVADGHKWMTGPEGVALFYCRPDLRDRLELTEFGWHMVESPHDFNQRDWRPAVSAQRFECGSPNTLGVVALDAALGVLLDTGIDVIEARLAEITLALIHSLTEIDGVRCHTSTDPVRRAGIVQFSVEGRDSEALYRSLMSARVICAARGMGVRFSPHFYTAPEVIDEALMRLRSVIRS